MTGLRYSPLHVTEFCGEMQGKLKVGLARLIKETEDLWSNALPGVTMAERTTWNKNKLHWQICIFFSHWAVQVC